MGSISYFRSSGTSAGDGESFSCYRGRSGVCSDNTAISKGVPCFFSRRQKLKLLAFAPNHLIYTYIPPWESLIESSMRSIHLFAELTKKRAGFLDEVY